MKINYPLLLLLVVTNLSCFSFGQNQLTQWLSVFPKEPLSGHDITFKDIVADQSGNTYVIGNSAGAYYDMDPSAASQTSVNFLAKYGPTGSLIFLKNFGSSIYPYSLTLDELHNSVYVVGEFVSSSTFITPGTGAVVSQGGGDGFVAKLSTSGTFNWVKTVGGTLDEIIFQIAVDVSENLYLYGNIGTQTTNLDMGGGNSTSPSLGNRNIIWKVTNNGNFIWASGFSTTGYLPEDMLLDANANLYVTGRFRGTVDFDPGAGVSNKVSAGSPAITEDDAFVQKLNSGGQLVWVKSFGGNSYEYLSKMCFDAQGNIATVGRTNSASMDADPGAGITPISGNNFVHKLNPAGDFVQAYSAPAGGMATGFHCEQNGSYLLTYASESSSGMHLTRMSPSGTITWTKEIGGTTGATRSHISAYTNGSWFVAGRVTAGTFPSVNFQVAPTGTLSATVMGGYLAKIYSGVCQNTNSAISVSRCTTYTVPSGHETYTMSGIYKDTIPNAKGCDSVITINLTIGDNLAPVKNVTNLANVTGQCSVTTLTAPTATDNCAGIITGTHNVTLPITASGTTVVTWTYTDGNGNTSTQTQNIVINDNTAPISDLGTLPDLFELCSVTSLTAPTATDNCAGTITGTHNATLPITTPGVTIVTWSYNDGNGNTSTQTQNVIITDNSAPVANSASLGDITNQCSVSFLIAPTATDNCAGTITGTHNASLPISNQGTTIVTWTYNDGKGNTSVQTQNVIIADNSAPVATAANLANITDQCSVTSLTAPTATDNCAGTITGTHNATLPITAQGTTVVTWTYNDGNGNTSTQTQNVIISDNTAPVANTANLANVTGQCSVASLTAPTATDNCAGTITGTHNATLPITASGTTVVTWTYTDGNGNSSTQTQNVVINDNTAPVANTANLANVTGQCSVTSLTAPTATDNCAGTIAGTHNATLPITTPGTTVVTWTYADGNGNSSTQTQNVIVTLPASTTTLNGITISATTTGATYQWINCGTGNTPIAGATSQSFTATANGTYAVIVTQNGCSATSACVAISTVGLEDLTKNLFTLYPNPNNGTFKIVIEVQSTITVTNAAGQLVSTQQLEAGENTIELLNAESGIYFVSATDSNGQSTVQRISIMK